MKHIRKGRAFITKMMGSCRTLKGSSIDYGAKSSTPGFTSLDPTTLASNRSAKPQNLSIDVQDRSRTDVNAASPRSIAQAISIIITW